MNIKLGQPVQVAEGTGHLWFPTMDILPGGMILVRCSGRPDDGGVEGCCQITSADNGLTWSALTPSRYGGVTCWRVENLLVGLPWQYRYENAERTVLTGELKVIDKFGKAEGSNSQPVRITGFPRSLAEIVPPATSSFATDCDGVIRKGNRMLTLGYGTFAGDKAKHRAAGKNPDAEGYSLLAIESLDGGANWRYLATVCDWTAWTADPAWADRARFEGPDENALVELADGSLLAVFRVGMFEQNPLHQCISKDGGKTWSKPKALPANSAFPSLIRVASGGLVLTTGRPGIWLWYSADGRGEKWEPLDIVAYHNSVVGKPEWRIEPTSDWNRVHTTSYTRVREYAPNKLLMVYDRIPFDWKGVPANSEERNRIFVLPIDIEEK